MLSVEIELGKGDFRSYTVNYDTSFVDQGLPILWFLCLLICLYHKTKIRLQTNTLRSCMAPPVELGCTHTLPATQREEKQREVRRGGDGANKDDSKYIPSIRLNGLLNVLFSFSIINKYCICQPFHICITSSVLQRRLAGIYNWQIVHVHERRRDWGGGGGGGTCPHILIPCIKGVSNSW